MLSGQWDFGSRCNEESRTYQRAIVNSDHLDKVALHMHPSSRRYLPVGSKGSEDRMSFQYLTLRVESHVPPDADNLHEPIAQFEGRDQQEDSMSYVLARWVPSVGW